MSISCYRNIVASPSGLACIAIENSPLITTPLIIEFNPTI